MVLTLLYDGWKIYNHFHAVLLVTNVCHKIGSKHFDYLLSPQNVLCHVLFSTPGIFMVFLRYFYDICAIFL